METAERIRIRYGETDQMGHAYYANYLYWFEQARGAWCRARGFTYKSLEAKGYFLPVVEVHVRYRGEVRYDDEGQLLSGTFMDYAAPRANQLPNFDLAHTVTPSPFNPLGVKGVGEAGTTGAPPALVNAALDALAPLGVRHLDANHAHAASR